MTDCDCSRHASRLFNVRLEELPCFSPGCEESSLGFDANRAQWASAAGPRLALRLACARYPGSLRTSCEPHAKPDSARVVGARLVGAGVVSRIAGRVVSGLVMAAHL